MTLHHMAGALEHGSLGAAKLAIAAFYLGADTLTEKKNLQRFQKAAMNSGMKLDFALAGSMDTWLSEYDRAQGYDLVIMGSSAGINAILITSK